MRLLFLSLALAILQAGCMAPPASHPMSTEGAGAAQEVWAKTIERIKHLEARRAPRTEWRAAAQFEDPVRSRRDLDAVVDGLGLSALDELEAVALFQRGGFVGHYGFRANFHALVFFDRSGRAMRVLR